MSAPRTDATEFFDEGIPRLFGAHLAASPRSGSIVFEVTGARGGRWKIALGPEPSIECVDEFSQGDLLVRMDETVFGPFAAGMLDVSQAVKDGLLLFAGDLSLLIDLGSMWKGRQSLVDVRAAQARESE